MINPFLIQLIDKGMRGEIMLSSDDKQKYMQLAMEQAKIAERQGEVPIGAVIVDPEGKVIGTGYNRRELDEDATQHAEMIAIKEACKNLGMWRLIDCSLFVTLEPCPMCAGAIINSRIKDVYFGALNHHPHAIRGLYRDQCAQMLKDFFRGIREKQKAAKVAKKQSENN